MNVKSIAAALGFVAALTAFSTAPASANVSTDAATQSTAARDDMNLNSYCGCGRSYVRYYRVVPVRYVYRVRVVRFYY